MAIIQISSITGTSPYQLYVSDVYDNNITFLGSFSGSVPPAQYFSLPELFNTAPIVKIIIIDSQNCIQTINSTCLINPSQTPSVSLSSSQTPTPTNTPSNTVTPSVTPTNTVTPSVTPTNTPSNTITPSVTPTNTQTNTPTNTPTSTNTPTNTPTNSETPTNTPTNTQTPSNTITNTPTNTPTNTQTPTNTPTPSETPTNTPTNTVTSTPQETPTNTPTITPTNTETPTQTPTNTPTNTETPTQTPTNTQTNTETPTQTPTNTPTNTETPTQTPTNTPTNTETPTNTPTNTETPTNTPTNTETPTNTPTPTNTETPTSTPTTTSTPTPTSAAQDINQTGLVLYTNISNSTSYPGTGTSVFDLSPNGYTGTIINSGNVTYDGGSTKSLKFNNATSSSPYINWGLGASLVRSASEITVCIFLRQISIPHGSTGFRWSSLINLDFCSGANRKFSFYMYNTSNNVNVAPNIALDFFDGVGGGVGFTLTSANWINQDLYIVASCKSGTNNAKAYINGVLQSPTKNGLVVNPSPSSVSNLMTGRGPGSCFDGFIGESNLYSIHIYNRTLTDAEVLSNYNILKTQFNIP